MSPPAALPEHRALKTVLVNGVSFLFTAGLGFFSVPICLRTWGAERYGTWLALIAGFTMLRTLDTGYASYVGNELNVLHHVDPQRLRKVLSSAWSICLGLGAVELTAILALAASKTLYSVLGVAPVDVERHRLGLSLGILVVNWTITCSYPWIINRLLLPTGLMYEAAWWSIVLQAAQAAALLTSAVLALPVHQAASFYALMQAGSMLAVAGYVRRRVPEYYPWWRGSSLGQGIHDLGQSVLLTISLIGQQATVSGMVLAVSSTLGTAMVPLFVATRTLSNVWTSASSIFVTPLAPEMVKHHSLRQPEKLTQIFRLYWLFSSVAVNGSMILAMPIIQLFFSRWANGLTLNFPLFFGMTGAVVSASFGAVQLVYLHGINQLRAQMVIMVARALLAFALSFQLADLHGIGGIGIAIWIAELISSVVLSLYWTTRELMRLGGRFAQLSIARPLLGMLPIQGLVIHAMFIGPPSMTWLAVAAVATALIGLYQWFGLAPETRARALRLLRLRASA
jgi:O-antigen/teichoic acid export membrane protein